MIDSSHQRTDPMMVTILGHSNEVIPWECRFCSAKFSHDNGGLCGSCFEPVCAVHLNNKICPECAPLIKYLEILSEKLSRCIQDEGYAIVQNVIPHNVGEFINRAIARGASSVYAIRNVVTKFELLRTFIESENILLLLKPIVGDFPVLIQSLLFDKPQTANWAVPWHQDLAVPVKERKDVPGYKNWTLKKGTNYVQPPIEVLRELIILRVNLDESTAENGALRIIPRSHTNSIVSREDLGLQKEREVTCEVSSGGVMLFRPLLLHASSRSKVPLSRKVLQFEFAPASLKMDLDWLE
ncbi:phytanoyl-CoA dioxygenase family protein [bacterium]|nr:phytanoyl-CoA dioxygenase family protein [bacterium]